MTDHYFAQGLQFRAFTNRRRDSFGNIVMIWWNAIDLFDNSLIFIDVLQDMNRHSVSCVSFLVNACVLW